MTNSGGDVVMGLTGRTVRLAALLFCFNFILSNQVSEVLATQPERPPNFKSLIKDVRHFYTGARAIESLKVHQKSKSIFKNKHNQFDAVQIKLDPSTITTKLRQKYKGIEVMGATLMLHQHKNGTDVTNQAVQFDLDVVPTISEAQAIAIAQAQFPKSTLGRKPELKIFPNIKNQTAKLVYWVLMKSESILDTRHVLVDAHEAAIVGEIPETIGFRHEANDFFELNHSHFHQPDESVAAIKTNKKPYKDSWSDDFNLAVHDVYDASDMPLSDVSHFSGAPVRIRLETLDKVVDRNKVLDHADEASQRAYRFMRNVQKYYFDDHDRDSYDERGHLITSIVHIGKQYSNAFWHPAYQVMAFGDGDGKNFGDFTKSIDVAGHEFTHAVVEEAVGPMMVGYQMLKGLIYRADSGALNEAIADLFGVLIEEEFDWALGQEVFMDEEGQKYGIRYLADPNVHSLTWMNEETWEYERSPYPKNITQKLPISENCNSRNDYCWVHINSTIIGHWGYHMVNSLGADMTKKILYATLNHYLTPLATFDEFKVGVMKACKVRYENAVCSKVSAAFDQIEL